MIAVYTFKSMDVSRAELCCGVVSELEKEILQEIEKAKEDGEVTDLSLAILVDGTLVVCDPESPFVAYFEGKEGYSRRNAGKNLVFFDTCFRVSDVLSVVTAFLNNKNRG